MGNQLSPGLSTVVKGMFCQDKAAWPPQERGRPTCRSLVTDENLRVKGSEGTIFSLGDSATVDQPKARAYAGELFDKFDKDRSGTLSFGELRALLKSASERFSHLEEHARFLDG